MADKLSESLEDYLEAIHKIQKEKRAARAKDIVMAMGVSNASVTGALRALAEKKLVNYAPYDLITLTDRGQRTAEGVIRRHQTLRSFLTEILGVEDDAADEAACKMEHAVSKDVLDRLSKFVARARTCDCCRINETLANGS